MSGLIYNVANCLQVFGGGSELCTRHLPRSGEIQKKWKGITRSVGPSWRIGDIVTVIRSSKRDLATWCGRSLGAHAGVNNH